MVSSTLNRYCKLALHVVTAVREIPRWFIYSLIVNCISFYHSQLFQRVLKELTVRWNQAIGDLVSELRKDFDHHRELVRTRRVLDFPRRVWGKCRTRQIFPHPFELSPDGGLHCAPRPLLMVNLNGHSNSQSGQRR